MHTLQALLGMPDLPERAFQRSGRTLQLWGKSSAPKAPDYAAAAEAQGEANLESAQYTSAINRPDEFSTEGSRTWSLKPGADPDNPQPGDWIVNTALSPEQQGLYDQEIQNKQYLGNLATQGLGAVTDLLGTPFDASGLPAAPTTGFEGFTLPDSESAFSADRKRVEDALYQKATQYYDPRFAQEEATMRNRLVNQGLDENSEAFRRQMDQFSQNKNSAYEGAVNSSIAAGGAEQSRQFGNLLQALTSQQNSAQSAAQAQQAARSSSIQEQAYLRQLPLNEYIALMGQSQTQMPQFQNYFTGAQVQAAPIYQATQDGYNAQMDAYNAQTSQSNALLGGLASIGGSVFASPWAGAAMGFGSAKK